MKKTSKSALTNADRSYSTETDSETSYDPASGHIVSNERRRHDDLKQMLDSNKDQLKLDAMRRIISLVARGRDFSDLYATVVKNVVTKNCEIRKLVCLFLIRYAEDQPDLALLPISTFQKAFKEPNQYIRADSVSTLSSIRVPLISQIILITITDAIVDLSPLVRKMAAIAITKIHSLGTAKNEDLEPLIAKLLCDHSLLVLNSAIIAFNEVCPHRLEFFHCKFKFMCRNLLDFDHWAQAVFLQIFTRYARDQFLDNRNTQKAIDDDSQLTETQKSIRKAMESDFQLLLTVARSLIYSDNFAVSLAYVQFYYYCGGIGDDLSLLVKPILRALDAHAEIKQLFLDVATEVSSKNKELFEPYVRHFFIQANDTVQTKQLKLTILTNLLNETNQFLILRELQSYLSFDDSLIIQSVIQAIGRCAHFSQRLRDICVQGLIKLLDQRNETILAETVLVLNDLLRSFGIRSNEIVVRIIKLLPIISLPAARAAILSLSNQYFANVSDICPNFPILVAKNFANEEYAAKLQILNLVDKMYAKRVPNSDILYEYATKMANYDRNYDIRDKTRKNSTRLQIEQLTKIDEIANESDVERKFANDSNKRNFMLKNAADRGAINLQFGTISYYFKERCHYCHTVPEFRTHVPEIDPRFFEESVEDVEYTLLKNLKFTNEKNVTVTESTDEKKTIDGAIKNDEDNEDDEDDEDDDEDDEDTSDSSSLSISESKSNENIEIKNEKKSNIDLLLELDGCGDTNENCSFRSSAQVLETLKPVRLPNEVGADGDRQQSSTITPTNPSYVSYDEILLLNASRGNGLQITYRFTRSNNLSSMSMVSIGLTFVNTNESDICNIQICRKYIKSGMMFHDFTPISLLKRSSPQSGTIAIDFNDSIQVATFEISTSIGSFTVSITPKMGELLRPVSMSDATFQFELARLRGLQELSELIRCYEKSHETLNLIVLKTCNLAIHQSDSDTNTYCGVTTSARTLLFVTIGKQSPTQLKITINCEKITVASILLTELKQAFNAN